MMPLEEIVGVTGSQAGYLCNIPDNGDSTKRKRLACNPSFSSKNLKLPDLVTHHQNPKIEAVVHSSSHTSPPPPPLIPPLFIRTPGLAPFIHGSREVANGQMEYAQGLKSELEKASLALGCSAIYVKESRINGLPRQQYRRARTETITM